MENGSVGTKLFFIASIGIVFKSILGPFGMLIIFLLITKYTNNFVLRPLARHLSAKGSAPANYTYGKLKSFRDIVWIFGVIFNLGIVFVLEMIAIGISIRKINEIKNKMGMPINSFSKDDYLIYDEYWKYSEYDEYEVGESEESDIGYSQGREYNYDDEEINVIEDYSEKNNNLFGFNVKKQENEEVVTPESIEDKLKKEIESIKEEIKLNNESKFDFDKPVEAIKKSEPMKTTTSSIWDAPISGNEEKSEPSDDEIRCEKCGTIMAKTKIACPKCGTLVKGIYRTGK